MGKKLCWLVLFCVIGTSYVCADTIYLKDGSRLNGHLISQDDATVVFDMRTKHVTARLSFDATQVECIVEGPSTPATQPQEKSAQDKRPSPSGPTYFTIPIKGVFGAEVTESVFRKCLNLARIAKPTVVVLEINSPGGNKTELTSMLRTLKEYGDLRIVAYVERAASAAAFLAMACEEIIISQKGYIGACVIYKVGPTGTPENIEAKFQSAERARFRAVALTAGHDPLLVEGMMRTDISLVLVEGDGEPKIVEGEAKGKIIKPKGAILTLTGNEAVQCGLALGLSESVEQCDRLLGTEGWQELARTATGVCFAWERELEKAEKRCDVAISQALQLLGEQQVKVDWWNIRRQRRDLSIRKLNTEHKRTVREVINLLKKTEKELTRAAHTAARYPELVAVERLPRQEHITKLRDQVLRYRKTVEAQK